jgi:hypothetical protein
MTGGSGSGTLVSSSVDSWVSVYWSGLKAQMDLIDTSLYADLVADAAIHINDFDISTLTTAEKTRVQALMICIETAGMPGLAGWSQERHLTGLKIADRTWKKDITNYDWAIGELCRILKITPKQYLTIVSQTDRLSKYGTLYTTNSAYLAPDLDQRAQVHRDYTLSEKRADYVANQVKPNRYNLDSRGD